MSTTLSEADLKRKYTEEERDAMFEATMDAVAAGNGTEANRLVRMMPIHPRWAKIIAEVNGKAYLLTHFNVTRADELYGEGWLDEFR